MEGIHIEICYSLSGGPKFTAAEKNAAEFTASLLKKYGWGIGKVTKHQDYDGKYCPHRTLDLGWNRFLNLVKDYLNTETTGMEEEEMTQEKFNQMMDVYLAERNKKPPDEWAEPAIAMCKEWRIMEGDDTGAMRPQSFIKREEAAQMFYSLLGRGQDADPWAKDVWDKAVVAGVLDGTNPRAPFTREQAVMVFYRLGLIPGAPITD